MTESRQMLPQQQAQLQYEEQREISLEMRFRRRLESFDRKLGVLGEDSLRIEYSPRRDFLAEFDQIVHSPEVLYRYR